MKPTAYQKRVARAMLEYKPNPFARKRAYPRDLGGWGSPANQRFLESRPNAFFMGMLFDNQVRADEAWDAPLELRQRLGHLSVRRIARMSERSLEAKIRGSERGECLHRFPRRMARRLILASRKLLSEYRGSAANIWKDGDAPRIIERLDDFHGVGLKLKRMMARLLGTYYGVRLKHLAELDIPVDRHVARVFLRTRLVPAPKGREEIRVSSIRAGVTAAARALSPEYPAALDEPAFVIGDDDSWCTQEQAYCDWPEGPCPLFRVCKKDRRALRVV